MARLPIATFKPEARPATASGALAIEELEIGRLTVREGLPATSVS